MAWKKAIEMHGKRIILQRFKENRPSVNKCFTITLEIHNKWNIY